MVIGTTGSGLKRGLPGPSVGPVLLVVFVLVAFIGVPVFLSWRRGRH